MVIEPPRDFGRGRVFEVDNRVLVTCEFALVKERSGTVNQAVIFVGGLAVDALAVEAREKGRRASPIKTLVVVEHANPQSAQLLALESGKTGKLSIMRAADCVKERGRSAV
jgi:hypothetical protein